MDEPTDLDDTGSDDTGSEDTELDDTGFAAQLTAGMHALVDGEQPSPELRQRIRDGLTAPAPTSRRRWLPAVAAALLVVAGIGAFVGLDDDSGDTIDVATDPSPADDADNDRTDIDDSPATTTTTAPSTTTTAPGPEVLGESITREEVDGTDSPAPPPPAADPAPDRPAAVPAPTSPPTTALVCRNSTDPACGAFRWEPQPVNRAATLTLQVPERIVAGVPFDVGMTISDPDGRVDFACYTLGHTGGGTQVGGGCTTVRQDCPARFGPWSPPAPAAGQATNQHRVTIDQPGTFEIYATVDPAAGCDNVDPYRSGASAERTIEVVAE